MRNSRSFSDGVDRLLDAIRPYAGQGEAHFPRGLDASKARLADNEEVHSWFVRLVDTFCEGEPKLVALEENIAVFVTLRWLSKTELTYANMQVLIATDDLDAFYLDPTVDALYLRLDSDHQNLGEPFSHPLPHIHVRGPLSPRFSLDGGNCGNVVIDFLEFIYRTYLSDQWSAWAGRVWRNKFPTKGRTPVDEVVDAFRSCQFTILQERSHDVARIKEVLRASKDELFELHLRRCDRALLEYPAAR